jgi:hypothetical protein
MALSDEARRRFSLYIDTTDPSNTNPDDDTNLTEFAAWALINDREALSEEFAFQSTMAQRGLTDEKTRYVQTILRVAPHLAEAIERERASRQAPTRPGEGRSSPPETAERFAEGVAESDAQMDARVADDAESERETGQDLGGEA